MFSFLHIQLYYICTLYISIKNWDCPICFFIWHWFDNVVTCSGTIGYMFGHRGWYSHNINHWKRGILSAVLSESLLDKNKFKFSLVQVFTQWNQISTNKNGIFHNAFVALCQSLAGTQEKNEKIDTREFFLKIRILLQNSSNVHLHQSKKPWDGQNLSHVTIYKLFKNLLFNVQFLIQLIYIIARIRESTRVCLCLFDYVTINHWF